MREPLTRDDSTPWDEAPPKTYEPSTTNPRGLPVAPRTLGETPEPTTPSARGNAAVETTTTRIVETGKSRPTQRRFPPNALAGRVLGTFRNTYYDFPQQSEFGGAEVTLHNAQCKPLAQVPRDFFEALCVQGSGLLSSGSAVSFNRRDCECAQICSKTQQRICFDALDFGKFPWGRGATGQAITPLLTVAVDSDVIALGSSVYIPDFDGLPRDASRKSLHDGCFIAQDRGLKVKGQHVDVFTGQRTMTQLWNGLVPSNSGVTVVLDSPKCVRAS